MQDMVEDLFMQDLREKKLVNRQPSHPAKKKPQVIFIPSSQDREFVPVLVVDIRTSRIVLDRRPD